jgi:DNA-binding response OmpR family regulator
MKHRILLIDDNRSWGETMQRIFNSNGFETSLLLNGEDALETAAQQQPDIILLDIIMQSMDGEEICRQLKINNNTANIPLIMFSSHRKVAEVAAKCGADGYIPKSLPIEEMVTKLHEFINKT